MTTTMTRSGAAAQPLPLAEEDNDKYAWRMNDPPNDFLAAVARWNEQEMVAELSALCKEDHTQHECAASALCAAPSGTDVSA
jgi:hypothetical protein